ncbi:MAG: hypothetical protein Q9219_007530 [cf. Caloplaca sp. 3 TL-2023]
MLQKTKLQSSHLYFDSQSNFETISTGNYYLPRLQKLRNLVLTPAVPLFDTAGTFTSPFSLPVVRSTKKRAMFWDPRTHLSPLNALRKSLNKKRATWEKKTPQVMIFNVQLWPGKQCEAVKVPQEKMRIRFSREGQGKNAKRKDTKPWFCVLIEDELRDVLVGISSLQNKDGSYRTSGLSASITLNHEPQAEIDSQQKAREIELLKPLLNLRFLMSVKIEGASEENREYLFPICHQQWDQDLVYSTVADLISAGDRASKSDLYDVATGYYNRAHDYALHFVSKEPQVITHPADPSAFLFKINLQRARNWIEQGDFEGAFGAADTTLTVANQVFRTNRPAIGDPPIDADGSISVAKFRKWTCECIKDGAAKFGQRIKCDDIGRAYYYRSIAGHVYHGNEATGQAYEDRALGIGCCVVSETNPGNLPNELLELDKRMMMSLKNTDDDSDEWEDCD